MLRTLLVIATLHLAATPVHAQRGATIFIQTKTMQGEIVAIQGSRLIWESEGKRGPIPYDQMTTLNVYASGDPGFVVPGAVVTVAGTLRPDKTITAAMITVHVNPGQTAALPGRASVDTNDPEIQIKGRLVSVDPLVMKAIDGIAFVTGADDQRAGANVQPIYDAVLKISLRDPKPEQVSLMLGSAPKLIEVGDKVTVSVREDRPNVANYIGIQKSTVLQSGRKKEEGEKGTEAKEGAKPASEN